MEGDDMEHFYDVGLIAPELAYCESRGLLLEWISESRLADWEFFRDREHDGPNADDETIHAWIAAQLVLQAACEELRALDADGNDDVFTRAMTAHRVFEARRQLRDTLRPFVDEVS